jgi:hypothetical protein
MQNRIIAVVGFIGEGKDTVSNYIASKYGFQKESFAKPLKDIVSIIFGWDRALLEGNTPISRHWREQIDVYWSSVIGYDVTPRYILQHVGTDMFRNMISPNIWSEVLQKKIINNPQTNYIISDVRFQEEINMLKKYDVTFVRVSKHIPPWYELGLKAANGNTDAIIQLSNMKIHESEWNWLNLNIDYTIDNTKSISELHKEIDKFKIYLSK